MNKIISVIVLVLVLAAPATYAQQITIEPVLRAGYDVNDNATLSIQTIDEADISGILLDASVRFGYQSPKTKLTATARLLERDYGDEEFDATEEFFGFRYDYSGQSSRFQLRGNYASQPVRTAELTDTDFEVDDPSEIPDDNSGLITLRDQRQRVDIIPAYTYDISDAATVGFDVRYTDVRYERQIAGLNDYKNMRTNLNFSRSWSPRNTALFGLTHRTYQADGSDSVSGYGVNGGIERLLSEKTTLRLIVGLDNTPIAGSSDRVEPVGEITLIRRLQTIRLLAQYRRVVTGGGSGTLSARDIININFTRELTERVSAGIGVRAYSTQTRQEEFVSPDDRDYVQLRAQVVWNLSRTFSLEANYRYTVLDRVNIGESGNSNNITFWMNWRPSGYNSAR